MPVYSRTEHMLISIYGARWKSVDLVMFAAYIDDSGTSPSQHVAIATALVIPAAQILKLDSEWAAFSRVEGFSDFSMSEFVHRNPRSEFAQWDDVKQKRVLNRVFQTCTKYGTRALSFSVNKKEYEEEVPAFLRDYFGKYHYTWAVRNVGTELDKWRTENREQRRLEFVFHWMERSEAKQEIEDTMKQAEWISRKNGRIGDFENYTFRRSLEIPGLQCVDAVARVCYQYAKKLFLKQPTHEFATIGWNHFIRHHWLNAGFVTSEKLRSWVARTLQNQEVIGKIQQWRCETKGESA